MLVLTGLALTTHLSEMKRTNAPVLLHSLRLAAGTFFLYGVFSGLVVKQGGFLPASALNYLSFTETIGIPVQVLRAACAVLVTICMIHVLQVFDLEARKTLKKSEDKFRLLFEQSPDGVLLMDTQGAIIDFNDQVNRQLGYTREEFSKLRIADIDPIESPEDIKARFDMVAREGK